MKNGDLKYSDFFQTDKSEKKHVAFQEKGWILKMLATLRTGSNLILIGTFLQKKRCILSPFFSVLYILQDQRQQKKTINSFRALASIQ